MIKLSVIIPTMNRNVAFRETLRCLAPCLSPEDEVHIMDQSTDEGKRREIEVCTRESGPRFAYHYLEKPSLTHARNAGIAFAKNDVIVMMDDDVSVQPNTISNVKKIMKDSRIALIAGINLRSHAEKSIVGYFFGHKSFWKKNMGHVSWGLFGRLPQKTTVRVETEWAMGYFFVIRRSLVEQWKLSWDEKLVSYGYPEDLDFSYQYCLKAKQAHLSCIVDPAVSVYHNATQEWRIVPTAVTYMIVLNREYLTYKWGLSFWYRLGTRWANFGDFLRFLLKGARAMDVLRAQFFCDRYRKDIRKGLLHPEFYINKK